MIDYALARRARVADVRAGRVSPDEACDAHPYLLRAAEHHGEHTSITCPLCRQHRLDHVTYVYGDELGEASGQARAGRQVAMLAERYGELRVFVVEVCRGCSWNHLVTSFVVGTGMSASVRRRQRAGD